MFVVRSLKVLNWESLLAIEQIVESKKTMKSIHTSWTIAFGNALIPFLSFFFFSRTCKKKQIPFLNGRGRGGTEQNKIPLYLSLGLCAFLNLSWVGLRRIENRSESLPASACSLCSRHTHAPAIMPPWFGTKPSETYDRRRKRPPSRRAKTCSFEVANSSFEAGVL